LEIEVQKYSRRKSSKNLKTSTLYFVSIEQLERRQLLSALLPGFGLYNPGDAQLTLDYGRTGASNVSHTLGVPGSQIVAADFNGDTITDTAAFLNGNWSIDLNNDGTIDKTVTFGKSGVIAVAGDITGNGTAALGFYNPKNGMWKFSSSQSSTVTYQFQDQAGGVPVLADWNNSGHDDLILYKAGVWTVTDPATGTLITTFQLGGNPGDVPIVTDFDGNGQACAGIFNNGFWRFDTNRDGNFDNGYVNGTAGEEPISGYFNPANSIFVAAGGT
jgi:hypothetical protein